MNDREMLEYAAKAAGYKVRTGEHWQKDGAFEIYVEKSGPSDHLCWNAWNPLKDDGDAFRLMVYLGMHSTNSSTDAWASTLMNTKFEPLGANPYAATRLAITRCAAVIGKAMEQSNG